MIHLITGNQGSGKTLYLVSKAYAEYKAGKNIYSNIALKFPYKPIDYNDIVNCKYENAMVIIDEGHRLLPSRKSLSAINISIVDGFLSMIRKKKLELYFSTQRQSKIDIRVRDEVSFTYNCTKWAYINGKWTTLSNDKNLDKSIPIMISMEVCNNDTGQIKPFSFYGNHIFSMYDSSQIINITGIDSKKKDLRTK